VTAAASNKVYDGGISSTAMPTITTGTLVGGDTARWTETYDNKNVGTTHVMTPAGSVSDGNLGNNYAVTFVSIATGVITPKPIIGSITANNKVYDGTTTATIATRTLTGAVAGDAVSLVGGTATFADKNVGNGKTVTAAGLSLWGADAVNYTVNSTAMTTANITPAPLTITADNKSIGDDSPNPPFTVTYHTLLGGDTPASLTGKLVCTTTRTFASPPGSYPITCSGQSSTNYTIVYVPGTLLVYRD
jgi:YDG domain/MBG domain (YGX type)